MWRRSSAPIEVSWCTITSGSARPTASATWSGSSASATTGVAPRSVTRPRLASLLREVVEVFDRVWYGYQPLDETTYQQYAAQVAELHRQ